MVPQSIPPSDKGRKLPWNSWDPPASRDSQWVEESSRPRAFRRNKTPSGWRNPPAHGPSGVPKPPADGGIIPPAVLPASKNLQWAEETPVCGNKKRGSRSVAPGDPRKPEDKQKKGVPGASRSTGTPTLNAAACYSPTPSRVQYHRRDQALASGFGKGPGVSPGP